MFAVNWSYRDQFHGKICLFVIRIEQFQNKWYPLYILYGWHQSKLDNKIVNSWHHKIGCYILTLIFFTWKVRDSWVKVMFLLTFHSFNEEYPLLWLAFCVLLVPRRENVHYCFRLPAHRQPHSVFFSLFFPVTYTNMD